ncbi:T9SS type A sorting domain-containing protein [Seonamhaeicola sp. MEBiC1930]|uniref:T9SS type A sorting domain-containing protein n=1 Tax=Seonamhaeicola sp. MEBiC01930 TaxID=2976768 RepID=UPI0032482F83
MKKSYFLILFFFLAFSFTSINAGAQNFASDTSVQKNIEGLSIFPNPVNIGRTFITVSSANNSLKYIEFFNVLGKRIYNTKLIGKELNISNLNKGVYIMKITENEISETRKLIIK